MQPQIDKNYNSKLTLKKYLELEQETNQKYEYYDGDVYAMAGGTSAHGRISRNVLGEVYIALRDKKCEVMNSDTKISLEYKNSYVYPDAMILCNAEESSTVKGAFTNPIVIIEVLSKSTASYDRGGKFRLYSQIPSLCYYVLIEQSTPQIDVYSRKNHTSLWSLQFITGLESNLELIISENENIIIPLTRIYDRVVFEEEE